MKRAILLISVMLCAVLSAKTSASVLKAMVLPGWPLAASGKNYGYVMLTAEAGIIGTLYYLNTESKALKQDSYEYAIKFAHLNPGSYNTDFFNNLARYESSGFDAGGYNAWVLKTAMEMYPYDPVQQQDYIDANSYGDERYWTWDSPANRSQYNKLRNRSQDYKDYAMVAGGVLILNHLVSTVDMLRTNAEKRRSHLSFDLQDKTPVLKLSYHW